VPVPDDLRTRWRDSGFRLVAVPVAEVDRIVGAARLVGQVQRQWLGEVPDWTDTIRGPALREPTGVSLHDGVLILQPGRLRLPIRAWIVPVRTPDPAGAAAALHVEIAPRLDPYIPERDRLRAVVGGEPATRPRVLTSLAATMELDGTDAILIVPDSPGDDWARPPAPPNAPAEENHGIGPEPAPAPTLGELLLSAPATTQSPRLRHILTLIPHVPERFELLAR
jgi:hypothetical protein